MAQDNFSDEDIPYSNELGKRLMEHYRSGLNQAVMAKSRQLGFSATLSGLRHYELISDLPDIERDSIVIQSTPHHKPSPFFEMWVANPAWAEMPRINLSEERSKKMKRRLYEVTVINPITLRRVYRDLVVATSEHDAQIMILTDENCPSELRGQRYKDCDWFYTVIGYLRNIEDE